MKRWLCGLLLLVLLGTGCAAQPYAARRTAVHDRVYQLDETWLSFEDSLSLSTDIVAAEFLGYDEQELYTELAFRVEAVRRGGTAAGETVIVVFFADTVAAGETVLVLANRSHPDSLVYTLSSARSVLPVEGDGGRVSFPAS